MKPFEKMFTKMLSPVEVVELLKPDKLAGQTFTCHSDNVIPMTTKSGDECVMELTYHPPTKNGDVPASWELDVGGDILRHRYDNSHFVPRPYELTKYHYYGGYYTAPERKYRSRDITYMGVLHLVLEVYEDIAESLCCSVLSTVRSPAEIADMMLDDLADHKVNPDGFTNSIMAMTNDGTSPRLSLAMSRMAGENFYRIRITDEMGQGLPRARYIATKSMAKAELVKAISAVYDEYYRDFVHDID